MVFPFTEEKCTFKALEIFEQFAENMSYADAFCPNLCSSQPNAAQFGWWGAPIKPGLTDEHVSVQESSDWLVRDTRASIRGAMEVANLESCRAKVKSLSEDMDIIGFSSQNEIPHDPISDVIESEVHNFKMLTDSLPSRDSNTVLRLDTVSQAQKR